MVNFETFACICNRLPKTTSANISKSFMFLINVCFERTHWFPLQHVFIYNKLVVYVPRLMYNTRFYGFSTGNRGVPKFNPTMQRPVGINGYGPKVNSPAVLYATLIALWVWMSVQLSFRCCETLKSRIVRTSTPSCPRHESIQKYQTLILNGHWIFI